MSNFYSLKVTDIRRETEDTVSVAFEIPASNKSDFQFVSGQYLTLKTTINNEEVRRSYSLSSAPFENEWRVAIKQVINGKFSTFANKDLKVGDVIDSMAPDGLFKLGPNSSNSKSYLLVCAGSGVTPIISIAKSVLKNEPNSKVVLVYGNQTPDKTIFKRELDELADANSQLDLHYVYSKIDVAGSGFGRITTALVNDCLAKQSVASVDDIFVCGPEEMIFDIKDGFEASAILKNKVHFELFTTPTKKEENKQSSGQVAELSQVTVIVDDEEFEFEMKPSDGFILDKAQEEDADVPFACKGGVCCTCKAKVMEGEVSMDVNYSLEPEEVEEGYILTCQARPVSDVVVVSFDE